MDVSGSCPEPLQHGFSIPSLLSAKRSGKVQWQVADHLPKRRGMTFLPGYFRRAILHHSGGSAAAVALLHLKMLKTS